MTSRAVPAPGRSPPCCRAAQQESPTKAHLGCRICEIKWLARNRIPCDGKGMHKTPCTQSFLCPWPWKGQPLFMCSSRDRCSKLVCTDALCASLLLGGSPGCTGEALGLVMAQAFASTGACTKPLPVWLRCPVHPSRLRRHKPRRRPSASEGNVQPRTHVLRRVYSGRRQQLLSACVHGSQE